jgi:uncharacterized protein YndB with AHSA1/START domain
MTDVDVIEVTVRITARPEDVFLYFTEPGRYAQWMGESAILDCVPGGIYRVRMSDGVEAIGEFVDVDPPHRIAFTWWTKGSAVAPGHTHVVVTFEPDGAATRVVLRHHDVPEDERPLHWARWKESLNRLALQTARG